MNQVKLLLLVTACTASSVSTAWCAPKSNADVPGVHVMGNGGMCVYAEQSDVQQIFGAPYSSPSFFAMRLVQPSDGPLQTVSDRLPQSATWRHRITDPQGAVVEETDFVTASGVNAFIRSFDARRPIEYLIRIGLENHPVSLDSALHVVSVGDNLGFEVRIAPNVPFYSRYRAPRGYCYRLAVTGAVSLSLDSLNSLRLSVRVGEGAFYVVDCGGRNSDAALGRVLGDDLKVLRRQSEQQWRSYSEEARFETVSLDAVQSERLRRAADDVAVLIRGQQDATGGVLAGIRYHMGYVRDEYGVSRALLSMGHYREARSILDFYFDLWGRYGHIKNAQAMGYPGIFHCHENDGSEITGYLVVQAIDYLRATGESVFVEKILPMLTWAVDAQRGLLIDGMMPFNGDETYIAGGLIPRQVMYHGSAEATLLFVEGTNRLLDFVGPRALWPKDRIAAVHRDVKQCTSRYRRNFYDKGRFYLNQPSREKKTIYPDVRSGVCLYPGHFDHFLVTYHAKGCLYYCADCMKRDTAGIPLPPVERYTIPSSFLFPIYIQAKLFTDKEKRELLDRVVEQYRATGHVSSSDRILGYDFGMFLYGLTRYGNPLAREVYDRMMNLRDATGAWVEYYDGERPMGCPCRPWESGINIEAAITYANSTVASSSR